MSFLQLIQKNLELYTASLGMVLGVADYPRQKHAERNSRADYQSGANCRAENV